MNKTTLIILIIVSQFLNSQSIDGAWERYETNLAGTNERYVAIFSNGFNSSTVYNNIDGEFISTNGGSWYLCLLYTSPSPRDLSTSRMPSSA